MSDKVIDFPGTTLCDLPVEKVLGKASETLEAALVIGPDEEGTLRLASTTADIEKQIYWLEWAKFQLMRLAE